MAHSEPLHYEPPMMLYRFMFSDGETRDVWAARDDSDLRGWMLAQHFGKPSEWQRVAAVVEVPAQGTLS